MADTTNPQPVDLDAIRERAAAASPGPWHWSGNTDVQRLYLANWLPGLGRCTVMDFTRWGMQSARPRFGDGDLMMVDADTLPIYEVSPGSTNRSDPRVYRGDIIGIPHPDATFIANSRGDVDTLLAEVDRLRDALAEVAKHQEDMADSLDEHITHTEIHEHLHEGMRMAEAARG